ncbi:MAG TPA: M1 family aminopeptidase [Bacteroidota bacterium]|nr:M1 family aminopeptidase [Bacteroidota bacterium]
MIRSRHSGTVPACTPVRYLLLLALLLTAAIPSAARRQSPSVPDEKLPVMESARHSARRLQPASAASVWTDILYYRLDLTILPDTPVVRGSVTTLLRSSAENPAVLTYDLMNTMTVDSVLLGGIRTPFTRETATLSIAIGIPVHNGDTLRTVVFYHGTPAATGLGSFVTASADGHPWIWSLSEPYGARDWWPCKDIQEDKADSADLFVTTDSSLRVGSNGILASVASNGDGTATWHWRERYPIATYLISVAIGAYDAFTLWYRSSPTDSMEILNYVLPESLAAAQAGLAHTTDGLALFSRLFGPYPFLKEKYGHSQFGGNAMEHQTMTSINTFTEETVIHELAHQWFGDMISCRSWRDIWLNEGFAVYCTAVYFGAMYGDTAYRNYIDIQLSRAKRAVGPVYAADTTDVRGLFDGARTYSKGATVLHMLRHITGDSLFFGALAAYAGSPALRYASATTADFEAAIEHYLGADFGYFFSEWIYGQGYPRYTFAWSSAGPPHQTTVIATIGQETAASDPPFFTMPLDLHMTGPEGDTTVTVFNNAATQTFTIALPFRPSSVALDEGKWVLRDVIAVLPPVILNEFDLLQNFPNPFSGSTTVRYSIPHRITVDISVYNLLGVKVATLAHGDRTPGTYTFTWTPSDLAGGVYYCRLSAGTVTRTRPMLIIR